MHFSRKNLHLALFCRKMLFYVILFLLVMFMYKIAIIEDDQFELEQTYQTLNQYCQQEKLEIQIDKYSDPTQFPIKMKYDALFLDIVMPGIDGLTLADMILEHHEPLFIFITHKCNFMINTFSVHAYDFIPKVNLESRLIPVFEGVIDRLSKICRKISFKTTEGIVCCALNDIVYIEIRNHTLSIITKEKTYECRASLRSMISKISHPSFILINQSTYINLNHIKNYKNPTIAMSNGDTVYVSRKYQKDLKVRLFKHYVNLI